jgi:hypothetical protein
VNQSREAFNHIIEPLGAFLNEAHKDRASQSGVCRYTLEIPASSNIEQARADLLYAAHMKCLSHLSESQASDVAP